jgi:hypothetical protein
MPAIALSALREAGVPGWLIHGARNGEFLPGIRPYDAVQTTKLFVFLTKIIGRSSYRVVNNR